MEAQKTNSVFTPENPPMMQHFNDPLIVGAGALILGFAFGSGRLPMLRKDLARIMESLGSFAFLHFSKSLKEVNPELFAPKAKMTH